MKQRISVLKKIINFKDQTTTGAGFTLIELIAVAGILVILSGLIASVLVSTLRGSRKSSINNIVAQNGSNVMTRATNALLNSEKIIEMNNSLGGVIGNGDSIGTISNIAKITVQDINKCKTSVECLATGIQLVTDKNPAFPPPPAPPCLAAPNPPISLIDTSVAVKSNTCMMTFTKGSIFDTPRIDLEFILQQAGAASVVFEKQADATFRTSITFRNY